MAVVVVAGAGTVAFHVYEKLPILEILDTTYSIDTTPSVYLIPETKREIKPRAALHATAQLFVVDQVYVSVPNELVLETRRNDDNEITVIVGPREKMLAVVPVEGHGDMVKNLKRQNGPLFTDREIHSSYDFTLASLRITPDGLSVLTPWESLVAATVLLSFKYSETSDASVIRPISIGSLRGMQVGDPDSGDGVVRVFLFPGQYRRIDLYFRNYASSEIASVLESLVA